MNSGVRYSSGMNIYLFRSLLNWKRTKLNWFCKIWVNTLRNRPQRNNHIKLKCLPFPGFVTALYMAESIQKEGGLFCFRKNYLLCQFPNIHIFFPIIKYFCNTDWFCIHFWFVWKKTTQHNGQLKPQSLRTSRTTQLWSVPFLSTCTVLWLTFQNHRASCHGMNHRKPWRVMPEIWFSLKWEITNISCASPYFLSLLLFVCLAYAIYR